MRKLGERTPSWVLEHSVKCALDSLRKAFNLQPNGYSPLTRVKLFLSCLAAIQAPVIMMSQNRQEARDRLRSEHDYSINLKAELEIRHLHEKMDHLLMN